MGGGEGADSGTTAKRSGGRATVVFRAFWGAERTGVRREKGVASRTGERSFISRSRRNTGPRRTQRSLEISGRNSKADGM